MFVLQQELCSPREASNSKKKADDPIEDESKAKFKHFVDVVDSTSAEQLRLETKMLGMSSPEACSEPREPTPPTDSGISVEVRPLPVSNSNRALGEQTCNQRPLLLPLRAGGYFRPGNFHTAEKRSKGQKDERPRRQNQFCDHIYHTRSPGGIIFLR